MSMVGAAIGGAAIQGGMNALGAGFSNWFAYLRERQARKEKCHLTIRQLV